MEFHDVFTCGIDDTAISAPCAVEVALNRGNAVIVAANVNLKAVDGVVTGTMYGVGVEMGVKTFMETVDMSQWEGYVIPL